MSGRICRIAGELFESRAETEACDGCAGDGDITVCQSLPGGCANGAGYIWLRSKDVAGAEVPNDAHEAHSAYPTPSGLYKPTHGGYPTFDRT